MGVKEKLVLLVVWRRLAKLGAYLEVGSEPKVRSATLYPKRNRRLTICSKSIFHRSVGLAD
jgi:hypothetical protein